MLPPEQAPVVSQVPWVRAVVGVAHEGAGPHAVPGVSIPQLPLPSQLPVVHEPAEHAFLGSFPAMMGRHDPSLLPVFTARHETQPPTQDMLQQTPSTQFPAVHSKPAPQGVPLPLGTEHFPLLTSQ